MVLLSREEIDLKITEARAKKGKQEGRREEIRSRDDFKRFIDGEEKKEFKRELRNRGLLIT